MARIFSKNICRVCLYNKEVTLPLSTNVKGSNLTEMINTICSSVKMKIGDKYPQNICIACFENLKNAWEFKTLCENTQDNLLKFYDECFSYNPNDKYNYFVPFTSEDVSVKTEKNDACVKKEILDTNTMKNHKDFMSSSSNFGEVLDDKLNDSSATVARLLENRQILVKNIDRSNLMKSKCEYQPNIITKQEQRFFIEELPISYEKCVTKAEFSNNDTESKKKTSKVVPCQKEPKVRKYKKKSKDICTICGKSRSNMKRHIEVFHNGGRSFTCRICQKTFKGKTYLKDHENQHTGIKKYLCALCGRSFVQNSGYRQHLRTHPEISTDKCKICNKAFPTPGFLKDHMNSHNNERQYSCNICHKCFFSKSNLNKHLVTHQERKRKCKVCNKSFHTNHVLKRHMMVHTGLKPFQCNVCKAKFTQKSDMRNHIMRHFKKADGPVPRSNK